MRLHEKGGKQHAMPCHHNLESYLHEYIDGAGLAPEPKALLFQTYSHASAAVVSRLNHLGRVNATGREAFRRLSPPVPASIVSSSYDSIAVAPAATAASPPSRTNQFVALTSKVLVQRSSTIPSRLNRIRGRVACFCLTSRSGAPITRAIRRTPSHPICSIGTASFGPHPQSGTSPLAVGSRRRDGVLCPRIRTRCALSAP